MKVAVLGGAGAMGCLFGGRLAQAGHTVTLVDVARGPVEAINTKGLLITNETGQIESIPVRATGDPHQPGIVDLIIVLVKGQHTEAAMSAALPLVGDDSSVLTLQNGWGNAARLARIVGESKVLAGVTLHSVTTLAPGHIQHAGRGPTTLGELDGRRSARLTEIQQALSQAGFEVDLTFNIVKVIWSKLALNVCALPACALLRFRSGELVEHDGTLELMKALLREVVAVANAKGIDLDFEERWEAITRQLERASNVRASMLQDVENRRQTEIDTVTGAIVECGRQLGVPTPYNNALFWLVKSLQETF
jgi:2-dehydropantoate 2-reductase